MRIPESACPECGTAVDSASTAFGEEVAPTPNDVTICLYCGAWLGFTEALTVRALTQAEIEVLPRDAFDQLVRAGHARAAVMRDRPKARR